MTIAPLSVQVDERITLFERDRKSGAQKEAVDAHKIMSKVNEAASLQNALGFGNPKHSVEEKKAEYAQKTRLIQAEKLAERFTPVKEPLKQFFPRFAKEAGGSWIGSMASGTVKSNRPPELVMVHLTPGIEKVYCRCQSLNQVKNFEANIPIFPLTALELASRAKQLAPDAEFHLLFMPSWEPAPQRDPVLVAHIPGTDEWFKIAEWDGDKDLINEFLEDR